MTCCPFPFNSGNTVNHIILTKTKSADVWFLTWVILDCIRSKGSKKPIWVYELHVCYPIIFIFQWKGCMVQQNICTTKQNNDTGHTDTVLYYTMNIKAVWKVFIVTYSEINVTILTHCGSFLPWLHKTWSNIFQAMAWCMFGTKPLPKPSWLIVNLPYTSGHNVLI